MAKTREVVMIGSDDRTTAEIARLAGTLPPTIEALTGVKIGDIVQKAMGAK